MIDRLFPFHQERIMMKSIIFPDIVAIIAWIITCIIKTGNKNIDRPINHSAFTIEQNVFNLEF